MHYVSLTLRWMPLLICKYQVSQKWPVSKEMAWLIPAINSTIVLKGLTILTIIYLFKGSGYSKSEWSL